MQKYIPVRTKQDQQSLTEFLNRGWIVIFSNSRKYYYQDDCDTTKETYTEYIISDKHINLDALINKPVETTNEQPKKYQLTLVSGEKIFHDEPCVQCYKKGIKMKDCTDCGDDE